MHTVVFSRTLSLLPCAKAFLLWGLSHVFLALLVISLPCGHSVTPWGHLCGLHRPPRAHIFLCDVSSVTQTSRLAPEHLVFLSVSTSSLPQHLLPRQYLRNCHFTGCTNSKVSNTDVLISGHKILPSSSFTPLFLLHQPLKLRYTPSFLSPWCITPWWCNFLPHKASSF